MRFRPEQHLRRQSDIRAPRESGKRADCQSFTVWHLERAPASPSAPLGNSLPRVCVVASTAAVGGAVSRNRAKRRLREVFRKHQDLVPPNTDLVMVARAAACRRPFVDLERRFIDACQRIAESRVS